jgi:lycopene beta-cyclase
VSSMPLQVESSKSFDETPDLLISGAGLSGLLAAWRCLSVNPELTIAIYETSDRIAGDHTWSFNATDIPPHLREWFALFTAHRWPRYDVKFPKRQRTLDIEYCSGNSDTLFACVEPFIQSGRLQVHLRGRAPEQSGVPHINATGYAPRDDEFPGWQKFVGHVIRTDAPHGVKRPVIMDARVEQIDGYRFMYVLPYSDRELLVEDTYFSDSPYLSENEISDRIETYIQNKGWGDYTTVRREKGVLPMMIATDRADDSAKIGLGGGFAVAATGFTVPVAVEVADVIAQAIKHDGPSAASNAVAEFRAQHIEREGYARLLNRMFFRAAEPAKRYVVLQRFYGLSLGLIRRFYRNDLSRLDKARILIGKPPVSVSKALKHFDESAFIRRQREEMRAKGQDR